MPLKLKQLGKLGISASMGVVDVGFEKLDEQMKLAWPWNAQTLGRAGLFIAGLVGEAVVKDTSKIEPVLEAILLSETPLLMRTAFKAGGVIADYQDASGPMREAIELRLKNAGQYIPRAIPGSTPQFR